MIFPRVHYAFAEFRGGGRAPVRAPSKYAPAHDNSWVRHCCSVTTLGASCSCSCGSGKEHYSLIHYHAGRSQYEVKAYFVPKADIPNAGIRKICSIT